MVYTVVTVFGLLLAGFVFLFTQSDTHATEVVIEKPVDVVWKWMSDPATYAKIYPNWVKSISFKTVGVFHVEDQFGGSYDMKVITSRDKGTIDLIIGAEQSSAKLESVSADRTTVVHIAKRWATANTIIWFFHKRTTDRDFKNAKAVIEKEYPR